MNIWKVPRPEVQQPAQSSVVAPINRDNPRVSANKENSNKNSVYLSLVGVPCSTASNETRYHIAYTKKVGPKVVPSNLYLPENSPFEAWVPDNNSKKI